jgi:hypothetical protein
MADLVARGAIWSEDQLRVLAAIFFNASFSIGDDQRDECRIIADAFGRTPSSVDRQWRNMAAVVKGTTGYNIGRLVRQAVTDYLSDAVAYKAIALDVCRRHDWPLAGLIMSGEVPPPKGKQVDEELIDAIEDCCRNFEFKIFPSGSQGFHIERDINLAESGHVHIQVSATLIGSSQDPTVNMNTSNEEIGQAVRELAPQIEAKAFNTGRVGNYGSGRCQVGSERFYVNIQAVQIGAPR